MMKWFCVVLFLAACGSSPNKVEEPVVGQANADDPTLDEKVQAAGTASEKPFCGILSFGFKDHRDSKVVVVFTVCAQYLQSCQEILAATKQGIQTPSGTILEHGECAQRPDLSAGKQK